MILETNMILETIYEIMSCTLEMVATVSALVAIFLTLLCLTLVIYTLLRCILHRSPKNKCAHTIPKDVMLELDKADAENIELQSRLNSTIDEVIVLNNKHHETLLKLDKAERRISELELSIEFDWKPLIRKVEAAQNAICKCSNEQRNETC